MICNVPCFLWRLSRQEILFVQLRGTQKDLNVFVIEVHEHLWWSKKQDKSVIVIKGKRNWKSREEKNKHWLVNIWISNLNIQHAKYKGDWKEHYCYFWDTLSCSLSQIKGELRTDDHMVNNNDWHSSHNCTDFGYWLFNPVSTIVFQIVVAKSDF